MHQEELLLTTNVPGEPHSTEVPCPTLAIAALIDAPNIDAKDMLNDVGHEVGSQEDSMSSLEDSGDNSQKTPSVCKELVLFVR